MSSTIRRLIEAARSREHGQVLVVFAGGLVAIVAIAALVFDTGQSLLDRRTEQNASDAAALAGARFIPTSTGTFQGDCASRTSGQIADANLKHVNTACDSAYAYLDADGFSNRTVVVKVPPGPESQFSNLPGNIEVEINSSRPSFFAGILGMATQRTGAVAVASNSSGYSIPYSLLSLDPTGCAASKITGAPGTAVVVGGPIHVDSNCSPDALLISGNGAVTAPSCDAVGDIQISGGATGCDVQADPVQASGDPLAGLPAPAVPANLGRFTKEPGEAKNPPAGCPNGAASSSVTVPTGCTFNASFGGHTYRMWPGYYPGGLQMNAGTFYMEPGIYYIGGGGIAEAGGGATMITVDTTTQTFGGGILIYNGHFSDPAYCTGSPPTGPGCTGAMNFNGSSATVKWKPIQSTVYQNMVIFGDRDCTAQCGSITLNGSNTTFDLSGTIYAANSLVKVNGSSSSAFAVQMIVYDFQASGSSGTLTVSYGPGGFFELSGVGLVQ